MVDGGVGALLIVGFYAPKLWLPFASYARLECKQPLVGLRPMNGENQPTRNKHLQITSSMFI